MECALIVSSSEKGREFFAGLLQELPCKTIRYANSCGEARMELSMRDFDLCIINSPVRQEAGDELALEIVADGVTQVILVTGEEAYEYLSNTVEEAGVMLVTKPIRRPIFWSALKLAQATGNRLKKIQSAKQKLSVKIEDMRIIDRAKCLLIACENMSEPTAHNYIEKEAMNNRQSKRTIAERILKVYES